LLNCRSLFPKVNELRLLIDIESPSFVFCTETWLIASISDSLINIHNYSVIRRDRLSKKGGGVMVYYKNNINVKLLTLVNVTASVEHICFIVDHILYILFYIPPNLPVNVISEAFETIVECVDEILTDSPGTKLCLLGDFNKAPIHILCNSLNLKNIVKESTRKNSILDYVLLSKSLSKSMFTSVRAPLSNSDHNSIFIFERKPNPPTFKYEKFFDLRASNIATFMDHLSKIHWEHCYKKNTAEEKYEYFQNELQLCINTLPSFNLKLSSKDKEWITPICKNLINLRWKSYRERDFELYTHYKNKVKEEILKSKQKWAYRCKNKFGLWNFVNKSAPKNTAVIQSLKEEGESIPELCARINEELIKSCLNVPCKSLVSKNQYSTQWNTIPLSQLTEEETLMALEKIKVRKAPGSDCIPNNILKIASPIIYKPLCNIFNTIIDTKRFPTQWKLADICVIPKSKPISIEKLRPISLLPTVSKVFERLLLDKLQPLIFPHIRNDQHGFMPKSSTTTCLLQLHNTITTLLDKPSLAAVTIISFDLRRAFDSIPHDLLIEKLSHILPFSTCQLLEDYLSNRSQQVKIDNCRSPPLPILSGVPQGSILSPILFNLFINDLSFPSHSYLYKYADDTTLVLPHFINSTSGDEDISNMIDVMKHWCTNNRLTLNTSKTQVMTIQKSRIFPTSITSSPRIKILGVTFSKTLKWDEQISHLAKKASKNIYLIRSLKGQITQHDLIVIYKSTILSILMYACELYIHLPLHLKNKLDKITKRCHSIICYPGCKCANFILPSDLRIKNAIKLFLKANCDNNHPLNSIIPPTLPRTKQFQQPVSLSERRRKSFIPFTTSAINNRS